MWYYKLDLPVGSDKWKALCLWDVPVFTKLLSYQRTPRNNSFLRMRNSQAVVATNQKGQTLIEIEEDCYGGLLKKDSLKSRDEVFMMPLVLLCVTQARTVTREVRCLGSCLAAFWLLINAFNHPGCLYVRKVLSTRRPSLPAKYCKKFSVWGANSKSNCKQSSRSKFKSRVKDLQNEEVTQVVGRDLGW